MNRALAVTIVVAAFTTPARAECTRSEDNNFFPIPVWGTTPNQGNTWGAMPVLVHVCPTTHETEWILAPSVTWNSVIHYTGKIRWYDYPDPDTTLWVEASLSSQINYELFASFQRLPARRGAWTDEAVLRVDRSAFARYFGIGPDTPASAETSYTFVRALASERRGLDITRWLNLGALVSIERDSVDNMGVPGLPLSPEMFPDAPGMGGATMLSQGLELRYDNRVGGDFADSGVRATLSGSIVEGLAGSPTYFRATTQESAIVPELDWLATAARFYWNAVTADDVPFYQQSQLGGSYLLRGFTEGRFTDRQAWTAEVEQRIRILQTTWFGVVTDWRADPFVAVGQVFGSFDQAFDRPQAAVGVGLRAFVHPRVIGRIDLAYGGEGLRTYVEIGYPY